MEVLSLISAPKYLEKQSSLIKKVEDTEVDTTELSAIKTFRPLFVFMVDFWAWFLNRKGFECYCIRTGSVQLDNKR
ncbi:unnamed protein product [Lactuca virosa]|uniref:Uncharacterized protein n=1 Tax=Lactuca virosa TaxID=75947 RepID=A0AAU9LXX0_9ASTR|nr:unnamed protein product [Lactuca virosa]CAH1434693.1 unnamed protein product [Lactuca virosa]